MFLWGFKMWVWLLSLRATPDECRVYRYGKQVLSACRHSRTRSGPVWQVQRRTTWPLRLGWPTPQSQPSLSRSFPSEWRHQRSRRENSTQTPQNQLVWTWDRRKRWSESYLVGPRQVAEFAEGSLVAVRHVHPATEEHQSAGTIWQLPPKHFNATFLLKERNHKEIKIKTECWDLERPSGHFEFKPP